MRLVRVIMLVASAVAGCDLRTGPEKDAQTRVRDGGGSGDGGVRDAGLFDAGGSDAGVLDAAVEDARALDAMPDTPHF